MFRNRKLSRLLLTLVTVCSSVRSQRPFRSRVNRQACDGRTAFAGIGCGCFLIGQQCRDPLSVCFGPYGLWLQFTRNVPNPLGRCQCKAPHIHNEETGECEGLMTVPSFPVTDDAYADDAYSVVLEEPARTQPPNYSTKTGPLPAGSKDSGNLLTFPLWQNPKQSSFAHTVSDVGSGSTPVFSLRKSGTFTLTSTHNYNNPITSTPSALETTVPKVLSPGSVNIPSIKQFSMTAPANSKTTEAKNYVAPSASAMPTKNIYTAYFYATSAPAQETSSLTTSPTTGASETSHLLSLKSSAPPPSTTPAETTTSTMDASAYDTAFTSPSTVETTVAAACDTEAPWTTSYDSVGTLSADLTTAAENMGVNAGGVNAESSPISSDTSKNMATVQPTNIVESDPAISVSSVIPVTPSPVPDITATTDEVTYPPFEAHVTTLDGQPSIIRIYLGTTDTHNGVWAADPILPNSTASPLMLRTTMMAKTDSSVQFSTLDSTDPATATAFNLAQADQQISVTVTGDYGSVTTAVSGVVAPGLVTATGFPILDPGNTAATTTLASNSKVSPVTGRSSWWIAEPGPTTTPTTFGTGNQSSEMPVAAAVSPTANDVESSITPVEVTVTATNVTVLPATRAYDVNLFPFQPLFGTTGTVFSDGNGQMLSPLKEISGTSTLATGTAAAVFANTMFSLVSSNRASEEKFDDAATTTATRSIPTVSLPTSLEATQTTVPFNPTVNTTTSDGVLIFGIFPPISETVNSTISRDLVMPGAGLNETKMASTESFVETVTSTTSSDLMTTGVWLNVTAYTSTTNDSADTTTYNSFMPGVSLVEAPKRVLVQFKEASTINTATFETATAEAAKDVSLEDTAATPSSFMTSVVSAVSPTLITTTSTEINFTAISASPLPCPTPDLGTKNTDSLIGIDSTTPAKPTTTEVTDLSTSLTSTTDIPVTVADKVIRDFPLFRTNASNTSFTSSPSSSGKTVLRSFESAATSTISSAVKPPNKSVAETQLISGSSVDAVANTDSSARFINDTSGTVRIKPGPLERSAVNISYIVTFPPSIFKARPHQFRSLKSISGTHAEILIGSTRGSTVTTQAPRRRTTADLLVRLRNYRSQLTSISPNGQESMAMEPRSLVVNRHSPENVVDHRSHIAKVLRGHEKSEETKKNLWDPDISHEHGVNQKGSNSPHHSGEPAAVALWRKSVAISASKYHFTSTQQSTRTYTKMRQPNILVNLSTTKLRDFTTIASVDLLANLMQSNEEPTGRNRIEQNVSRIHWLYPSKN